MQYNGAAAGSRRSALSARASPSTPRHLDQAGRRHGEMKWDMAGAGVVIGLMRLLAARHAKVNAVGIVGLVENMPSGTATRPGDIIRSLSGQTIEV